MTDFTNFKNRLSSTPASDECYTPTEHMAALFQFLDASKTYYEATATHSDSIIKGLSDGGFNIVGSPAL